MQFTRRDGTTALLRRLAMGQVAESPFEEEAVRRLREQVVRARQERPSPVDFRSLQLLLSAAEDREVSLGEFARRVTCRTGRPASERGGPLPIAEEVEPEGTVLMAQTKSRRSMTRQQRDGRTTASIEPWMQRVLEVLEAQCSRGQVPKLTETEARGLVSRLSRRFAGRQVRSQEKHGGVRSPPGYLFDGTFGFYVNRRTRVRDH